MGESMHRSASVFAPRVASVFASVFASVVAPVLLALCVFASRAEAHPGSGLVVDRDGTVYFVVAGTNLIMRVARDGRASVLVNREELRLPHHLVLSADGSLYAASDFDGKVWRVGRDGSLREYFNSNRATRPTPGRSEVFVGSFGDPFTIDPAGNIYALASRNDSAIIRVAPDGKVTPLAKTAKFGPLHFGSMAWGPEGALYLSDARRVWRIVGDSATPIEPSGVRLLLATGLAVDSAGNIYVADYSARRVVRLAPDGAVNTPPAIARLRVSRPTGVFLAGGAIYVLDNPSGETAVWRVVGNETDLRYRRREGRVYAVTAFLVLFPLLLALQTWVRTPSGRVDWFVWTVPTGAAVGLLYWAGQDVWVFSIARHAILGLFMLGALSSWRRRRQRPLPRAGVVDG